LFLSELPIDFKALLGTFFKNVNTSDSSFFMQEMLLFKHCLDNAENSISIMLSQEELLGVK